MKNKWFRLLLLVILFKSLIWIILTPPFQIPDENIHFAMIQYLGENHQFPGRRNPAVNSRELLAVTKILNFPWMAEHPVWRGIPDDWREQISGLPDNLKSEFISQVGTSGGQKLPTGYYWLNFPTYLLLTKTNFLIRFYSLRLMSMLLGLGTVYLAYLASKKVFKSNLIPLTVAAWVGFQPMASVIFSGITYDSLAIFLASLFIYLGLIKKPWWALLVAGVGFLTKGLLLSLLLIWPLLLKRQQRWLLLPVAGLLVWLIYHSLPGNFNLTISTILVYTRTYINSFSAEVFPWYWGVFGWLEKVMPLWVYRSLKILTVLSVIGWIKTKFKRWPIWLTAVLISVVVVIFGNDLAFFARNASNFGVQGRYFLPALIPQMILLVWGWFLLMPIKFHRFLAISLIALAIGLNLIGLNAVYQFFGWIW